MDSVTMKLSGTLGVRHRCFNALVHEAYQKNTSLPMPHPEEAALDRLFKIDLASKQRNVDFIIHTLKDDDLLYVNRALKSQWLLEPQYSNIINPIFLETELFPHMTLPAVNKTRHWIQMHLRDPQRCKEFHQFYKELDVDIAVKFLWHCSNEYVLGEISNVLHKITPKLLKRLSEKVPRITKIYYDSLRDNKTLLKYYLTNDSKFFANIKYLLKTDASIFFYVLENFFVPRKFGTFNAAITKSIMKDHKSRFLYKPELYTVCFLDMTTLARQLSSEEIKELVLKLARAEYLKSWFSYKSVEPLIERLSEEERLVFTTSVFVDKAYGLTVKEWPYPVPVPPVLIVPQKHFHDDVQLHKRRYLDRSDISESENNKSRFVLKKPKHARNKNLTQTLLDQLFEKYRFCTYGQTFVEFQKQLKAESTAQNRMFMLLVLVSKTGGRTEHVVSLLDLLSLHKNEPVHIRAAIVRSLVKRACVWRLPHEHWTRFLKWGHDLGLDGSTSEANCSEGFHAVLIRDLLADGKPSEAVWEKFLTDYFNTLKEYSFTADERRCIRARLPALLLNTLPSKPDDSKLILLNRLLDTLEAYHVRFDDLPADGVVDAVIAAVKYNWDTAREDAEKLLKRLYDAGVKRKLLIREYFEIRQTDASYVNALHHDISILVKTEKFEKLIEKKYVKHDKFFRKLALYFMEKKGLGEKYCAVLEHFAASGVTLARCRSSWINLAKGRQILALPLALLSGSHFPSLLKTLDAAPRKTPQRQLAAALRSNAHVVRPAFNLESFGWRQAGAKAVANRVATCRERDVERYLQECLTWRRTLRLALVPAKRVNKERDAFQVLVSQRPGTALRAAFGYFCRKRASSDLCIWEMVKSHISKLGIRQLRLYIDFIIFVPAVIKAEYCYLVYKASKQDTIHFQCKVLSEIPAILVDLNEQYIYDAIGGFMYEYFNDCVTVKDKVIVKRDDDSSRPSYITEYVYDSNKKYIYLYIEIIAKFLVLSTSEEMLEDRYGKVALPFLRRLELFWKQISHEDVPIEKFLDSFLYYLRYNKVYFDCKYVSCLPVFEKITEWMHGFLPIEKWFDKYAIVHLTTIYYKTVDHCNKQNADLLSESNALDGSYMLGTIFGKVLSNEIEELTQKYFLTITELYGQELVDYIDKYITQVNNKCFMKFMVAVLKTLVMNKAVASCILAKYVFEGCKEYSWLNSEYINDMYELFNECGIKDIQPEYLTDISTYSI